MEKGKKKGNEEKEIVTKKVRLKAGVTPLKAGQIITSDQIEAPPNKLIESIAVFLWMKYDRTKLSEDWNRETPQRKIKWITDAQTIRELVDEYYEE